MIERVVTIWIVVYPVLTLVSFITGPYLEGLPTPLKTLIMSGIMVPFMVIIILPAMAAVKNRLADTRQQQDM